MYRRLTLPEQRAVERGRRVALAFDRRRRGLYGRDQEDPFGALVEFLETRLSPEDLSTVGEILSRLEDSAVANHGDRRRLSRDEPPPFPGRPRPGGTIDPLDVTRDPLSQAGLGNDPSRPYDREGQDRALRRGAAEDRLRVAGDRMAYDTRGETGARGFTARYPSAARIRVS